MAGAYNMTRVRQYLLNQTVPFSADKKIIKILWARGTKVGCR